MAFTPDGKLLVIGSYKGVVRVADVTARKVTRSIDLDTPVHALAASSNYIVVGYGDGSVAMLNLRDQESIPEAKEHHGAIRGLAFSHDGRRFASASADQAVMLWWDTETLKPLCALKGNHSKPFPSYLIQAVASLWFVMRMEQRVAGGLEATTSLDGTRNSLRVSATFPKDTRNEFRAPGCLRMQKRLQKRFGFALH